MKCAREAAMPQVESSVCVARPPSEVFAFFLRPTNLLALAPPEIHLELLEGPDLLQAGARLTWKTRRLGISQRIVTEITALEPDRLLVEEQREGPLRKFIRTLRFEEVPEGTRLTETIEFEPPGGLLGFVITAGMIEQDLRAAAAHRDRKLPELLGAG
jgi:ligand-binding SRPBCC domain-containing protein